MSTFDQATEPLTPKQTQLIETLLTGVNIATAAKNVGIGDKTARRWLKMPQMQEALRSGQQSLFDDKLNALRIGVSTAIATLLRNMKSEETPPNVQVAAAKIWLVTAIELHKMSALESRIAELEEYIAHGHR